MVMNFFNIRTENLQVFKIFNKQQQMGRYLNAGAERNKK